MTSWELKQELTELLHDKEEDIHEYTDIGGLETTRRIYRLFFHDELYEPTDKDEWLYLGLYYLRRGNESMFLTYTEKALQLGSERAYVRFSRYYRIKGKEELAEHYIELGLQAKSPSTAFSCIRRRKDRANEYIQLAVEWGSIWYLQNAGKEAGLRGDYQAMKGYFRRALMDLSLETQSQIYIYQLWGNYYWDVKKKPEKAVVYWKKTFGYPPYDIHAKYNLATYNLVPEETKWSYFREIARREDPQMAIRAQDCLVSHYLNTGQRKLAYETMTKQMGLCSDLPPPPPQLHIKRPPN